MLQLRLITRLVSKNVKWDCFIYYLFLFFGPEKKNVAHNKSTQLGEDEMAA